MTRLRPLTTAALLLAALLPAGAAAAQEASPEPDTTGPSYVLAQTTDVAPDGAVVVEFDEPVTGVTDGTLRLRSTPSTTVPLGDEGRRFAVRGVQPLALGAPYVVEASPRITDAAGNAHVPAAATFTVVSLADDSSPALRLLGDWSRLSSSSALLGSYSRATPTPAKWAAMNTSVWGKRISVGGCTAPDGGILELWVDGRRVSRFDTSRSTTTCGVSLTFAVLPTGGLHHVDVRGMGERGARSTGTAFLLDGLAVAAE